MTQLMALEPLRRWMTARGQRLAARAGWRRLSRVMRHFREVPHRHQRLPVGCCYATPAASDLPAWLHRPATTWIGGRFCPEAATPWTTQTRSTTGTTQGAAVADALAQTHHAAPQTTGPPTGPHAHPAGCSRFGCGQAARWRQHARDWNWSCGAHCATARRWKAWTAQTSSATTQERYGGTSCRWAAVPGSGSTCPCWATAGSSETTTARSSECWTAAGRAGLPWTKAREPASFRSTAPRAPPDGAAVAKKSAPAPRTRRHQTFDG